MNEPHRHTSLIRTMREGWSLGAPLTARDADAPDPAPVLSLDTLRDPADWPDVVGRLVPEYTESTIPLGDKLGGLAQAFIGGAIPLARKLGADVPEVADLNSLNCAQGLELPHIAPGHLFPELGS